MNNLKEIELFSIDTLENIAIVEAPAIQIDFLCFNKEKQYAFTDNSKHILTGPFLIPEKRILRYDEQGTPFNIYFSKSTVEKIAYEFMNSDKIHAFNLAHEKDTDKLTLIESWVKVDENDKSTALGIDVPVGTWLGSVKVNDDKIWKDIMAGKYNGFSIAGLFSVEDTEKSEEETLLAKITEILKDVE